MQILFSIDGNCICTISRHITMLSSRRGPMFLLYNQVWTVSTVGLHCKRGKESPVGVVGWWHNHDGPTLVTHPALLRGRQNERKTERERQKGTQACLQSIPQGVPAKCTVAKKLENETDMLPLNWEVTRRQLRTLFLYQNSSLWGRDC